MTKLHTAVFRVRDHTRLPLSEDEVADIGADIMARRLPFLRRLSVNGVMWEVGDVLEFLSTVFSTFF